MEYIAECYEKRIVLSQIEQGAVFDQYEDPLFWLGDSMICNLYSLDTGRVYCEYPMISFEMKSVKVSEAKTERVIDDYDELKAWWQNEN